MPAAVSGWTVRRRYRHILQTLARHGLGFSLARYGLAGLIPFHRGWLGHPPQADPYTQAQHLRLALEELGVAFIKLGQVLSTRADLLPPEFIEELSRLQASVPPVPFEEMEAVLREELGEDYLSRFARFDREPLAAASIGQVYRARLRTGPEVVVKVQRPGLRAEVAVDLAILRRLARRALRTRAGEVMDVSDLMEEFALTLERELDYVAEGRNADRFRANLKNVAWVRIPRVFWEHSTTRVLTMEAATGVRSDDEEALDRLGLDRHDLAVRSARLLLKMVFEDGFFHADPHPGNFFLGEDGSLTLVDFGMVGSFGEVQRERLVALLGALARQDAEALVEAMLDLGAGLSALQRQALTQEVGRLLSKYAERTLADISLQVLMTELFQVAYRHRLRLPSNLALLAKTVAMAEGLGRRLDPGFRFMDVLLPYSRRLLLREYGPRGFSRRLPLLAEELLEATPRLPGTLYRVLRRAERGDMSWQADARQYADLTALLRGAAARLAASVLLAGLLVAAAVLIQATHDHPASPWHLLAGVTLASAGGLALWFLRALRRWANPP